MRKSFLLVALFLLVASGAEARYVRKVREPSFFIPAQDRMHKPEKLPPIVSTQKKSQQLKESKEVYTEIPPYKTIYSRYAADMAVLANSKVLPETPEVDADLAFMSDGAEFEVTATAPEKITTQEQKNFYLIAKKILNTKTP